MKSDLFLFRFALLALMALAALPATLFAATQEKNGVRIDVVPKTVGRNDGTNYGYYRDIDRTLTMKAVIKNVGFNDLAAGKISYTIILHRWGMSESATFDIEAGTADLVALRKAEQVEVLLGEFGIAGHMHGTSKEHLDKMEAWQLVIESGDKKIVFESSSNFATLKKRAEREK